MSGGQFQLEAYNPVAARSGAITVIAVTTSSAEVDLSTKEVWTAIDGGRMVRLRADGGDVYYNTAATSSGSVDDTATTGATQGDVIPFGDFIDVRLAFDRSQAQGSQICKFLRVKGSIACKLRITVSSEAPGMRDSG